MSSIADQIRALPESRNNFIKELQNYGKKRGNYSAIDWALYNLGVYDRELAIKRSRIACEIINDLQTFLFSPVSNPIPREQQLAVVITAHSECNNIIAELDERISQNVQFTRDRNATSDSIFHANEGKLHSILKKYKTIFQRCFESLYAFFERQPQGVQEFLQANEDASKRIRQVQESLSQIRDEEKQRSWPPLEILN